MPWPYDDDPFVPEVGLIPQAPVMAPPVSEPDYFGEMMSAPQEPMPDDFFARLAMASGSRPFNFQPRPKPTGLEVILAGLQGFGNARAAQGARRVAETKARNEQAREAAKTLATWRHQERMSKQNAAQNLENIRATIAGRASTTKTPAQIEAEARAAEFGRRKGAIEAGETPAEIRARESSERSERLANIRERLSMFQTVNALGDDYKNDPSIKGYREVRSNLISANTASKLRSGPGDIALIFSFMRALEPENVNVVREGEFSNARQAAGTLQKYTNLPARFFAGTQLTDEGRRYFLRQMGASLRSRQGDFKKANDEYLRRAKTFGVEPNLFIREYAAPESGEWVPPGAVPLE